MSSGVYEIECAATGQRYIGTGIDWMRRASRHRSRLQKGTHKNKKLQAAWGKYGEEQFQFRLLELCPTERLLEREKYWSVHFASIIDGFNNEQLGSNSQLTHGLTHTGTHKSWEAMLQRCTNLNAPDYSRYGGVGIKVCERWRSFENFLADMGHRPDDTSIDRHPNKKGNYEPGNCRWATREEQQRNLKSNVWITYNGKTQLAIDWSKETGIPVGILQRRARLGTTGDDLFAPTYHTFEGITRPDGSKVERSTEYMKRQITAFGRSQSLDAWAEELGINPFTLKQRIYRDKMSVEKALTPGYLKRGKAGPREGSKMLTAFGKAQSLTN